MADELKDLKLEGMDEDSWEEFGALMLMSDENFAVASPLVMEQIRAAYSDINTLYELAAGLRQEGVTMSQLYENRKGLEEQLKDFDEITQLKKDFLLASYDAFITGIASTGILMGQLITIPVELIEKDAKLPTYAHITDAGADVYAYEDYTIEPGETVIVRTGIKVAIPKGYELQVRPKSGITSKTALRIGNAPGTIDAGYRDEIGVIVQNTDAKIQDLIYNKETGEFEGILYGKSYKIEKGQKIAQLVVQQVPVAHYAQVESVEILGENRGGGFGSTGLD